VKKNKTFRQVDFFSVLALLGIVLMLLFESIFIFELYGAGWSKIAPFMPESIRNRIAPPAQVEPVG
jgi:hypothetical protein